MSFEEDDSNRSGMTSFYSPGPAEDARWLVHIDNADQWKPLALSIMYMSDEEPSEMEKV